jgi:cyclopropane fatty-acyl-phospholipid synthase-like methyltransferase
MVNKFDPNAHLELCSPERLRLQPVEPALELLGLEREHVLIDLGCGSGYFLLPAASRVQSAWGLDISPELLRLVRKAAVAAGIRNVRTMRTCEHCIPGPTGAVDRALAVDVLHEMAAPIRLLGEIRRVLASDGRLLVIDWNRRSSPHGPPSSERVGRERARGMLARAGFRKITAHNIYKHHYALLAEKSPPG